MKEQNWRILNKETVEERPKGGEDGGSKIEQKSLSLQLRLQNSFCHYKHTHS